MKARFEVVAGSTLYMSGEQDWYVRVAGEYRTLVSFMARPDQAEKIQALLNRDDE